MRCKLLKTLVSIHRCLGKIYELCTGEVSAFKFDVITFIWTKLVKVETLVRILLEIIYQHHGGICLKKRVKFLAKIQLGA